MEKIKEFIAENRFMLLVSVLLLFLICWLHADGKRNEPIYHNTDNTVGRIESRISGIESRLDGMSKRIEQNQKTIESVGRGISTSTGLTYEIIEGTGRAEKRLESAIGRSKRIESLISDIEKANR